MNSISFQHLTPLQQSVTVGTLLFVIGIASYLLASWIFLSVSRRRHREIERLVAQIKKSGHVTTLGQIQARHAAGKMTSEEAADATLHLK